MRRNKGIHSRFRDRIPDPGGEKEGGKRRKDQANAGKMQSIGGVAAIIISIIVILLMLLSVHFALAHSIYTNWKMPDQRGSNEARVHSCCNNQDCAPRETRRGTRHWEVLFNGAWRTIPENKIEQNYADTWESPDGRSHVCINPATGTVLCATLGSGT